MSLRMQSASEYRRLAEQCIARAEAIAEPLARVRWLQLAEQWALLSRLGFQPPSSARPVSGLWRGEFAEQAKPGTTRAPSSAG
jgi:hypothetical protein